jgi:hypothetical protein
MPPEKLIGGCQRVSTGSKTPGIRRKGFVEARSGVVGRHLADHGLKLAKRLGADL